MKSDIYTEDMKKFLVPIVVVVVIVAAAYSFFKKAEAPTEGQDQQEEVWLDVRTQQEWDEAHLEGAVHFDLARLQTGELPDIAKDSSIAVYCRSGNRAGQAEVILESAGYTNVRNAGGLTELQSEGFKVCSVSEPNCL